MPRAQIPQAAHDLSEYTPLDRIDQASNGLVTTNQMRWLVRGRETNGLDKYGVLVRFGRRLFVHMPSFLAWLDARRGSGR